jgi:hypothetical protein
VASNFVNSYSPKLAFYERVQKLYVRRSITTCSYVAENFVKCETKMDVDI